jgi:hypothetical protein
MFKPIVKAGEATKPYDTYDSILERPGGSDPNQNAWLTLQLRIKLKFADSKNKVTNLTVQDNTGQWCARDTDGYLFPLLDWPAHLIDRFQREFIKVAERTWNWQFMLKTPGNYSELDYSSGNLTIRPNVLCLFRMALIGPSGGLYDSSPAAGPLRNGNPHRTINIVNISLATTQVKLAPGVTPSATKPATKTITRVEGLTWRSNANNYDDSDLFNPSWWNPEHTVLSNTVGHEVGHALGQCHVMGLKGIAAYKFGGAQANDPPAYGVGSSDPLDVMNIMGGGNRLYLLNAVSWQERIALHTKIPASQWIPTGMMDTPTRKMSAALTNTGLAPATW